MLSREWLQAFVPVGVVVGANKWSAVGAGVVFHEHDLLWLVTARHVVVDAGYERVVPLLNKSDGGVVVLQLADIQRSCGFSWLEDEPRDLAATPLPIFPGLAVKAVTKRECIPLREVVPSMPSYTVGCPYGVAGLDPTRPGPLVLDGVVSGTKEQEGLIYTSAPTFPGNSGGPLVVYRNPFRAHGLDLGETVLFAGVVLATNLVVAPNQHRGMPPLHLGVVRSSDAVVELLLSDRAKVLADRLRSRSPATRA
jgi:S1-C subfamily serine protease